MSIRIGVAGLGYWGPNLARNFAAIDGCELAWCCDGAAAARERWAPAFPSARFTAELDDLLADERLDAVALATPVTTHGPLAEGVLRADENALWSLGAHDVSVVLHLADEEPYEIEARGESYMRPGIEDVVFCFLRFPSGLAAHLHLSWLDPHKERRLTVVGSRRMATFGDMELERKLTVYDKGFDESSGSYGEYITRSGDIWSPRVPNREPLRIECEHFVECVRSGAVPRSDGVSGLRVVRVLEALQERLDASRREHRAAV